MRSRTATIVPSRRAPISMSCTWWRACAAAIMCSRRSSVHFTGRRVAIGRIGIEVQIESALGLVEVDAIAASSSRIETIIFGPADFMASVRMRTLVVGEQPPGYDVGDAYHYVLLRLLVAARAHGVQAIDGPYLAIHDLDGLRRVAQRSAALGYDGKWVVHPGQIAVANEVFAPSQADFDRAEIVLDAYDYWTSATGGMRGAEIGRASCRERVL